jgi:hypothetical protein
MTKTAAKTETPRFRFSFGEKTYDFLLNTAKVAGVLSLIYGVGFGIFQYYESKAEKRVAESLSLFRQFNNAPFTGYRQRINIALIDNRTEIANAATDEKQLAAAIGNVVRKEKLEPDLAFVFNFFDTVVYCAAKNICDPDVTFDLFYPNARELYIPFYQYIRAQQNSFNDFGLGIQTLIKLKQATTNSQPQTKAAAK